VIESNQTIVGIDPGRRKCGLVLADANKGEIIDALVIPSDQLCAQLTEWHAQTPLRQLVIGNGTSSRQWQAQIKHLAPVVVVNEAGTTLRARERYWQIWPARGWRRLLPKGLRLPPCELDAVAALVLLEDQRGKRLHWPSPPPQGPGLRTELAQ
jgi:RNase H-fold protein (predicted Holliday junction resolvase)